MNPVAVGKTRGRQQTLGEGDFSTEEDGRVGDKALCIQVHGDAAFSAQVKSGSSTIKNLNELYGEKNWYLSGCMQLLFHFSLSYKTLRTVICMCKRNVCNVYVLYDGRYRKFCTKPEEMAKIFKRI